MAKKRHKKARFHSPKFQRRDEKSFAFYIKTFFFWFVIYSLLVSLFTLILKNFPLYEAKIGFSLIMGFLLVLSSRAIYSAWHKKSFRLSGIIIWGVIYAIIFGLLDYISSLLPQIKLHESLDLYLNILVFSIFFTIILMFTRRMKIRNKKEGRGRRLPLFQRAPSQILSGIVLFISGLLVFRFSYQIFVGWFNWVEGMAWSWLIGFILIIAGILTLIAWWRNNVSMFTTKHHVKWN